jgi:hypothetical protein
MMQSLQFSLWFQLIQNEVRLRIRRRATLVVMLVVIFLSYSMVVDPATGHSMMVFSKRAVAYDSQMLAISSATLACFVFGLAAFYLSRGRTREDLMVGVGNVLAATPVSNVVLNCTRWIGAMGFLIILMLTLMATMMVLQAVRGVGSIEPFIYLQTYALLLLPTLALAAGIALLCDSLRLLMGKGGDVLYFFCWLGQFSILPMQLGQEKGNAGLVALVDTSGIGTIIIRLGELYGRNISIGGAAFDPALPTLVITDFWTTELVVARLLSMLIAIVPIALACHYFHRYAPDRVGAVSIKVNSNRRGLWAWINHLSRFTAMLVQPLFWLSRKLPSSMRMVGQTLAELALTLRANPFLFLMLIVIFVAGLLLTSAQQSGLLIIAIACWGVMISDISARDIQCATAPLTSTIPGGATRGYSRQLVISLMLGLMYAAPILAHWIFTDPTLIKPALTLLISIFMLAAAALLLGQLTRSGRTFLGLFLFGLYLAVEIKFIRWFDLLGLHHQADLQTMSTYFVAAIGIVITSSILTWRRQQ